MRSSAKDLQCIVQPNMPITRAKEDAMLQYALTLLASTRREQGWRGPGQYERASWFWKRAVAMRRYGGDFTDRLADPIVQLWKTSNRSFELPSQFVDQHKARIGRNIEPQRFFALVPDDDEDAHPALKPAERYLQARADAQGEQGMSDMLVNKGIMGALQRGESIYKVMPATRVQRVRKEVQLLLQPDGRPAKDSEGQDITSADEWIAHPQNPALQMLRRDPQVTAPAGMSFRLSDRTVSRLVPITTAAGAEFSFPFWGDMVISPNYETLDKCPMIGQVFECPIDDLFDLLPTSLLTPNARAYQELAAQSAPTGMKDRPELSFPSWRRGEQEEESPTVEGALGLNTYAEMWFRFDADGDYYREPLMLLADVHRQIPIAYGLASDILKSQTRKHPFGVIRVYPEPDRWYGRGYNSKYDLLSDAADADLNRLEIEKAKSGNLIFTNSQATEQGKSGQPLAFRTPQMYTLSGQNKAADAVSVVTVAPQTEEIAASMEKTLGTLAARGGSVTPGETEGADLQAANTATGLQILQESKNDQIDARENELNRGIKDGIETFSEIEIQNPDLGFANDLFGKGTIPVPIPTVQPDPVTGQPIQVMVEQPVTKAQLFADWVKTLKPGKLRSYVRLIVTRSRNSQAIQMNDNVRKVLADWDAFVASAFAMFPADAESMIEARKPVFVDLLSNLEVANPEKLLFIPAAPLPVTPPGSTPGGAPGDQAVSPPPDDTRAPIPTGRPEPQAPPEEPAGITPPPPNI